MELLRVFNNNVVLAREPGGGEVVLTGRGLGFQARPGQAVDSAKIVRVFRPSDGRDPDHIAQLLAGIDPEVVHLVVDALAEAGLEKRATSRPTLVIALADHMSLAIQRAATHQVIEYPLIGEVQHLYADEYAHAQSVLRALNARLDVSLPDTEAVAVTLHLVNSGFTVGDLSWTYQMTGLIQQMFSLIEQTYDRGLDAGSVNVGRFITHLRYLFVRIQQHRQLADGNSSIGEAINTAYPIAHRCAQRCAAILQLRLGSSLTEDEVSYLTLHVARLADDDRRGG